MTELDITKITKRFGKRYTRQKQYDKLKQESQILFFKAATQELKKQRLPQKTVTVPRDDFVEYVGKHYPGWQILDWKGNEAGECVLQRNPNLMAFEYVNPDDQMVYKRSETETGPRLDNEALQEQDPELWEAITTETRTVNDPSTWTTEQAAAVQKYLLPGEVGVRLTPPRPANKEELEELNQ